MKKLLNILAKKAFISSILFLVEMIVLMVLMVMLEKTFLAFWFIIYVLNIFTFFMVVNSKLNNAFKLSWLVFIFMLPGIGVLLFFIFGKNRIKNSLNFEKNKTKNNLNFKQIFKNIPIDNNHLQIMQWTYNVTQQPTYCNTSTTFLNSGELYFKNLIIDLKLAKKNIFLEFFIINPGHMWNTILSILIEKAKKGLDIKLIYDDFGTLTTLNKNYDQFLNKLKIQTKIFNKIKLKIDSFVNNRDHRKIVIIDDEISYTGGINIADEYINKTQRLGYWQDSAIKIKGEATKSLTALFLNMWNSLSNKNLPKIKLTQSTNLDAVAGLVMPFGDNPMNENRLNSRIYLKIINTAKNYIYIQTPYLVMDEQLTNAIKFAAQSNVTIIIITPKIFDKFYVHTITQNSYADLIKAGVQIYEYTPGFIHSKMIVADSEIAVLGTANFDYRSLYMQFENGVLLWNTKSINQIVAHFKQILKQSSKISIKHCKKVNFFRKLINILIKPFIIFL